MAGLNFYQRILNRLSSFHNIDNSMKSPCSVPGKEMNSGDWSWTNEVSVRKLDLLCNHQFAFEFNYYVRNCWKIRLENCHRYERLTGYSWMYIYIGFWSKITCKLSWPHTFICFCRHRAYTPLIPNIRRNKFIRTLIH